MYSRESFRRCPEQSHSYLADQMQWKCDHFTNSIESVICKFYDSREIDYSELRKLLQFGEERVVILGYCHSSKDVAVENFLKEFNAPQNELVDFVFESTCNQKQ